jgi:hypothetical protein
MPPPTRLDRFRKRFSPAWKGSRGIRLASPALHFALFGVAAWMCWLVIGEDRRPTFIAERPPVAAPPPPPGVLSFEASCEMTYRKGRGVSSGIGAVLRPRESEGL